MDHDSEAALRRVAIVLSSLPEATVARLMMGLGDEQQRAVRTAISRLSDVDPLERRRVLDAFADSVRRGNAPLANENDAAEIVLSRAARQHPGGRSPHRSPAAAPTAPLAFLSDVDDDTLAAEIQQEHPQTIAIIMASLAPAQAARMLQRLDVTMRQETMRRLGKLDAPSPEVINDISGQLKNKLLASGARFGPAATERMGSSAKGKVGQDALRAILAEMPVTGESPSSAAIAGAASPDNFDSALLSGALRDAATSQHPGHSGSGSQGRSAPASRDQTRRQSWPEPAAAESAEAIHARLVALPTERLRQALASVDTRQSLLALCGLPSATAEKVLAALPRRQARQVRRQLADLGTIELREIDRAKAAVAAAADWFDQGTQGSAGTAVRPRSLMAA